MAIYPQQVINTQKAIRTASLSLMESFSTEPKEIRECMTNALLNIAVTKLIADEGKQTTATILWRLIDCIENDGTPTPTNPADLSTL
tara:strand:- start:4392 stop:4652 length:261 start_codon:yes stop_codon:yes gene_type:complete